jgi:hypothetical protein
VLMKDILGVLGSEVLTVGQSVVNPQLEVKLATEAALGHGMRFDPVSSQSMDCGR